jgi:hypothetical protein
MRPMKTRLDVVIITRKRIDHKAISMRVHTRYKAIDEESRRTTDTRVRACIRFGPDSGALVSQIRVPRARSSRADGRIWVHGDRTYKYNRKKSVARYARCRYSLHVQDTLFATIQGESGGVTLSLHRGYSLRELYTSTTHDVHYNIVTKVYPTVSS